MKLTIEETIRGMITGQYTHAEDKPQNNDQVCICNYRDNYYGDRACVLRD
ncbi:hypothetical protein R50073_13190 [Maricurvus nonylphenolicus]